MINQKKIRICLFSFCILIILSSFAFAAQYPNPRLGETLQITDNLVDLETCFFTGALDDEDKGLTFVDYYEKYKDLELPTICQDFMDMSEIIYEEGSDYEDTGYVSEEFPVDSDNDGFTDLEEDNSGTDKFNSEDFPWWIDFDGDGYINQEELLSNSNLFDSEDTPTSQNPDLGTTEPLTKKKTGWQIYLAIALGVLLIIITITYFIYYNKR